MYAPMASNASSTFFSWEGRFLFPLGQIFVFGKDTELFFDRWRGLPPPLLLDALYFPSLLPHFLQILGSIYL